jgi:hypothetical protein
VVPEFYNAARIALEDEHHAPADLGCGKCHDFIPKKKRGKTVCRAAGDAPARMSDRLRDSLVN